MCGLFGFSGKENVNINKFKILALYNDSRGGDSTGIFFNGGEIVKDVKNAFKFFNENLIEEVNNDGCKVVYGHTRKASSGGKSKDNAHPFKYVGSDKNFHSSFAHNGTLYFWKKEMAEHEDSKIVDSFTVDSHALGLLVANSNYKYLETYDGAVTYLAYKKDNENTLEVFKGATYNYHSQLEADRPMFALRTKEGMYFSSLVEALNAIKEEGDEFVDIPVNKVLFFKEGELVDEKVINRNEYSTKAYGSTSNYNTGNYNTNSYAPVKQKKENASEKKENVRRFWSDTLDYSSNVFRGAAYFNKGRYYRNGHLLNSFSEDEEGNITIIEYFLDKDGNIDSSLKSGYHFFNGLLIKSSYCESKEDLIKTYATLKSQFDKGSRMTLGLYDISRLISNYIHGVFAFLDEEIKDDSYRMTLFKNGNPLTFKDNKGVLVQTKFARNISILIKNFFEGIEIHDILNYDKDYRKLNDIVNEPRSESAMFYDYSFKNFKEYTQCDNEKLSTSFLSKLAQRFSEPEIKNEKVDEIEVSTFLDDLNVLEGDLYLFKERIEKGVYSILNEKNSDLLNETTEDMIFSICDVKQKIKKQVERSIKI